MVFLCLQRVKIQKRNNNQNTHGNVVMVVELSFIFE